MSNFDSPYLGPPVLPDYKLREARDSRHEAQQRDAEFTFLALRNRWRSQAEAAKQGSEVGLLAPFSAEVLHVREVGWTGRNTIHIKGIRAGSEVRPSSTTPSCRCSWFRLVLSPGSRRKSSILCPTAERTTEFEGFEFGTAAGVVWLPSRMLVPAFNDVGRTPRQDGGDKRHVGYKNSLALEASGPRGELMAVRR